MVNCVNNRVEYMKDKNKNQSSDNPAFIVQFLALNLLILAFFILLVSMSTFEANKTKAVVDSIKDICTNHGNFIDDKSFEIL